MRSVLLVALVLGCGGRVGIDADAGPVADTAVGIDSGTPASCGPSVRSEATQPSGRCSTPGLKCRYEVHYTCPDGSPRGTSDVDCECNGTWNCTRVGGGFSFRPCEDPPPSTDGGVISDTSPPLSCLECQKTYCAAEMAACQADMYKLKGCNDLISCINSCSDAVCANKCITDSPSSEGKALVLCVQEKCAEACSG
jgi:hypothetical protein